MTENFNALRHHADSQILTSHYPSPYPFSQEHFESKRLSHGGGEIPLSLSLSLSLSHSLHGANDRSRDPTFEEPDERIAPELKSESARLHSEAEI